MLLGIVPRERKIVVEAKSRPYALKEICALHHLLGVSARTFLFIHRGAAERSRRLTEKIIQVREHRAHDKKDGQIVRPSSHDCGVEKI